MDPAVRDFEQKIELPTPCALSPASSSNSVPVQEQDEDVREREATELDDVSILSRRATRLSSVGQAPKHWYDPFTKLWHQQIRVSVPHVDCRDHLGEC